MYENLGGRLEAISEEYSHFSKKSSSGRYVHRNGQQCAHTFWRLNYENTSIRIIFG